jgi:hypothetical protein
LAGENVDVVIGGAGKRDGDEQRDGEEEKIGFHGFLYGRLATETVEMSPGLIVRLCRSGQVIVRTFMLVNPRGIRLASICKNETRGEICNS